MLYHGMGSGKTATVINLLNIIYVAQPNAVFIILIKASLRNDPWLIDLETWLHRTDKERNQVGVSSLAMYQNIHLIHYDANNASDIFSETMKRTDPSIPVTYVVDEAHNFFRNVLSNMNSTGNRALKIYSSIQKRMTESTNTRVILMSATPTVKEPFELALQFNLLRPGLFPSTQVEFDRTFITKDIYPILNPLKKNMFQRRILGLVSYYIGATPDLYARKRLQYVELPMSAYQYKVYREQEIIESKRSAKAHAMGWKDSLFRVYTRHASNFVFPDVNETVTGINRPKMSDFGMDDVDLDAALAQAANNKGKQIRNPENAKAYIEAIQKFLQTSEAYFKKIGESDKKGNTLKDNMDSYSNGFESRYQRKFRSYWEDESMKKSKLLLAMYECSPKMTAIVFNTYSSPGKVLIYTTYVIGEGVDAMVMYLNIAGYGPYDNPNTEPGKGYMTYHGGIKREIKNKQKADFNMPSNVRGTTCNIFILTPSGAEGIQLLAIRQEHILEGHWNEVRIQQVTGRGLRQGSHCLLPMNERIVDIFRYILVKPNKSLLDENDKQPLSTDQQIDAIAKSGAALTGSFLSAMKEAAVDCALFRSHNQLEGEYSCFQFPEESILSANPGPAYHRDMRDDVEYDIGSNAENSKIDKVRVYAGQARDANNSDAEIFDCWYRIETGIVYDHVLHYPIGKVTYSDDKLICRTAEGVMLVNLQFQSGFKKLLNDYLQ